MLYAVAVVFVRFVQFCLNDELVVVMYAVWGTRFWNGDVRFRESEQSEKERRGLHWSWTLRLVLLEVIAFVSFVRCRCSKVRFVGVIAAFGTAVFIHGMDR
ncbi:hypothetical protein M758_10G154500 [Ceratodon purpureus]|nr:hypothetical protein M758_10G154500 [Ceratodon purpureus]